MRSGLAVRRLTPADAEAIASWRYPGRDSTYDEPVSVTPERGYWAVARGDELVGRCCFGAEARVRGVEQEEERWTSGTACVRTSLARGSALPSCRPSSTSRS